MLKTFRYRIYPTKSQQKTLNFHIEECRWLYNHFLEQRVEQWEKYKKSIKYYDQATSLPALKISRPSLAQIYSQVAQNVAVRIDIAFKRFFKRLKAGEKPGFPRYKGFGRYNSITFSQLPNGCQIRNGFLRLSRVGSIKIVLHQKIMGTPKTCTIKRTPTGKWYANFSCETGLAPCLDKIPTAKVGIDVGLSSFATLSTGEVVGNPRFFKSDEKALGQVRRRLSKSRGLPKYAVNKKSAARVFERISFRRRNFAHILSKNLISRFGFIAVEDININNLVHNRCLAKSIFDVSWSMFFNLLSYKAVEAGRTMVKVNPAYTSQTCSSCGHRQKIALSERVFNCPCCRTSLDRDHNAALNILKIGLGQQAVGQTPESPPT